MIPRLFASFALLAACGAVGGCLGGPQTDPPGDRVAADPDGGVPDAAPIGMFGGGPDAAVAVPANDAGAPDAGSYGLTDTASPRVPRVPKFPIVLPPVWRTTTPPDASPMDGAR